MLAFIDNGYIVEEIKKSGVEDPSLVEGAEVRSGKGLSKIETRIVLKLDPRLSPIKVAILPLSKKENLQSKAREIWKTLNKNYMCEYDESGSVGKRYRRQDEIGTPYCITVDFYTVGNNNDEQNNPDTLNTVTVRDRDTMQQERVKIEDLGKYLAEKFS